MCKIAMFTFLSSIRDILVMFQFHIVVIICNVGVRAWPRAVYTKTNRIARFNECYSYFSTRVSCIYLRDLEHVDRIRFNDYIAEICSLIESDC